MATNKPPKGHVLWWPLLELLFWCPIISSNHLKIRHSYYQMWTKKFPSQFCLKLIATDNISPLIQVMAWRRIGDKPIITELMVTKIYDSMHQCSLGWYIKLVNLNICLYMVSLDHNELTCMLISQLVMDWLLINMKVCTINMETKTDLWIITTNWLIILLRINRIQGF